MKHFILAILLFPFLSVLSAQEPIENNDYIDSYFDSTVYRKTSPIKPLKKVHVGVNVDMGYSFSSNGYGGPMFMLSPYASYPISKKFFLCAGISAGYGSFYNPYMSEQLSNTMLPMTQMFIYAAGNYSVNERLSVSGMVYNRILDVPNNIPGQAKTNFDSQGGTIGFQYKLTPNISFGAQIRVDDSGFYNNQYNSYGYGAGSMYGPNWW